MDNAVSTPTRGSMLGTMRSLLPGQSAAFPIRKVCSVKTIASTINATRQSLSLSTKIDRESGTVMVTRNI